MTTRRDIGREGGHTHTTTPRCPAPGPQGLFARQLAHAGPGPGQHRADLRGVGLDRYLSGDRMTSGQAGSQILIATNCKCNELQVRLSIS